MSQYNGRVSGSTEFSFPADLNQWPADDAAEQNSSLSELEKTLDVELDKKNSNQNVVWSCGEKDAIPLTEKNITETSGSVIGYELTPEPVSLHPKVDDFRLEFSMDSLTPLGNRLVGSRRKTSTMTTYMEYEGRKSVVENMKDDAIDFLFSRYKDNLQASD